MHTFHHKKQKLWSGFHLAGIVLLSTGLIILATSFLIDQDTDQFTLLVMVGSFFALGILSISTFSGTLLIYRESKIKNYQAVFWIKFGNWISLPPIDKLDMIIHSYKTSNFPNALSPTLSYQITVYKVVLLGQNKVVLDFDYPSQEKASKALEELRRGFDLE
jgi:hypothetical protein